MSSKVSAELPIIPDKLYFTIGETSDLCGIKPHVLRYWEQEFSQLKPTKRRGGRRYYQSKDIELIRYIRELLYLKGFTIAGAKQQMHEGKVATRKEDIAVEENQPVILASSIAPSAKTQSPKASKELLTSLIGELESLLELLEA